MLLEPALNMMWPPGDICDFPPAKTTSPALTDFEAPT